MFEAGDIYSNTFTVIHANFIRLLFILTFSLNLFLLHAIMKKTPTFMKSLKVYLIPYTLSTIIIQIVFVLYTPILLHPYLYIYPIGLAVYLPRNLTFAIVGTGAVATIEFTVCSIGMAMERNFALRNIKMITTKPTKVPFKIFIALSVFSFCIWIAGLLTIYVSPWNEQFFISSEAITNLIDERFANLSQSINTFKVFGFRGAEDSFFAAYFFLFGFVAAILVISFFGITSYNLKIFYSIKNQLSFEISKNHALLLKIAYLQLCGIFFFLGISVVGAAIFYLQVKYPSYLINIFPICMNCLGLYDTFLTIFCIKPYRLLFYGMFKRRAKPVIFISSIK